MDIIQITWEKLWLVLPGGCFNRGVMFMLWSQRIRNAVGVGGWGVLSICVFCHPHLKWRLLALLRTRSNPRHAVLARSGVSEFIHLKLERVSKDPT